MAAALAAAHDKKRWPPRIRERPLLASVVGYYRYSVVAEMMRWFGPDDTFAWASVREGRLMPLVRSREPSARVRAKVQHAKQKSSAVIRKLTPHDAEEVTWLLVENRERHRPFQPLLPDTFFTVEAQRDRLMVTEHIYGILDAGDLAGTIMLSNLVGDPFRSATIGYWVDDARRGRGLATAAVAAIAELAFGELALHRLEAATLVENEASRRVLEKNLFVRIGLAPHYLQIAGAWRDHLLFQRTTED